MRKFFCLFLFSVLAVSVQAGASAESSGSSTRGKYLAGEGIIIPEADVYIDSYIAQIDYAYPVPENDLGVFLYTGHRQVTLSGQNELVHVGIQGKKLPFEDLPPMNLAFVIDVSGSMADSHKLEWVKEAFYIFIDRVREVDFVSLVTFNHEGALVFPSTRMDNPQKKEVFKGKVQSLQPGGGTNLVGGLELGYAQVQSNFRKEYTNRVLFLTDGQGTSMGILDMAYTFREQGINVSTIGVGTGFDLQLMTDLAKKGGGSSRFISDREEMEKTFGSELDRMVVPLARELRMSFELLVPGRILETWGYDNKIEGNKAFYSLATFHRGDYETILLNLRLDPVEKSGLRPLGRFLVEYTDLEGKTRSLPPREISLAYVEDREPVLGYSSGMVLQSGTMLEFAKELKAIARIYYSSRDIMNEINRLTEELWRTTGEEQPSSPEIKKLEEEVKQRHLQAFNKTKALKGYLENVKLRLDNQGFDDEIFITDKYLEIIGRELGLAQEEILTPGSELPPLSEKRQVTEHLENFFNEIVLDMALKEPGPLAVAGFASGNTLGGMLDEMALVKMSDMKGFPLLERKALDKVFAEQQLALSDLGDTTTAIKVGNLLSARYILTGAVIEMSTSVIIFGRVVNVESGEVESVAQVILEKNEDVQKLLESKVLS